MEAGRARDKYSERVEATLAPSPLARAFVGLAAAATLTLAWALPVAAELRMLAVAWVAIVSLHALGRLRRPRALALDRAGAMCVDGVSGRVRDGSFVAPWLTVLRWRPDGARLDRALLVAPDTLAAEEFRRLRVLLKFGDRNPGAEEWDSVCRAQSGDPPSSP
jgi:toxin CptA